MKGPYIKYLLSPIRINSQKIQEGNSVTVTSLSEIDVEEINAHIDR